MGPIPSSLKICWLFLKWVLHSSYIEREPLSLKVSLGSLYIHTLDDEALQNMLGIINSI